MICPGRGISDREVAGMTQLWMGLLSDVSDTGIEQSVGSVRGLWAILYSNSILREGEGNTYLSYVYPYDDQWKERSGLDRMADGILMTNQGVHRGTSQVHSALPVRNG
jgi:hypothetical protein